MLADDIIRGFEPGGFTNFSGVLTVLVWRYGTLVLAERRSEYVIILHGSRLGTVMPLAHLRGAGLVGSRIVNSSGAVRLGLDDDGARRHLDVLTRLSARCGVCIGAGSPGPVAGILGG